jgi:hypothetical protein
MPASNEISIILSLQSAQALQKLNAFIGQAASGLTQLAVSVAGIASVTRIAELTDNFSKLGEKIGETIKTVSGLVYAFDQDNVSAEALQKGLKHLSEEMIRLGESDKSVTQKLLELSDMFQQIPDGARKSALAVQYFGKAGVDLIPTLNQGSEALQEQLERGERLRNMNEGLAVTAKQALDTWKDFKIVLESLAQAISANVLPTVTRFLEESIKGLLELRDAIEAFNRFTSGRGGLEGVMAGRGGARRNVRPDLSAPEDEGLITKDQYDLRKKGLEISIQESKVLESIAKNDYTLTAEERQKQINAQLERQIQLQTQLKELDSQFASSGGMSREDLQLSRARGSQAIVGLQTKIEPGGLASIMKDVQSWMQSLGTISQQIAATITSTLGTAFSSIGQNITGVIMRTQSWGQALANISNQVMSKLISSIIEMGIQWLTTHILMRGAMAVTHAIGEALKAQSTASTISQETAKAPILAANAATSSVSSYGASAVVGAALAIAAIGAIIAAASAREYGGPVVAGRPYIVGEKRPELFVPSQNGYVMSSVPSPAESMAMSGMSGGTQVNNEIQIHSWPDEEAMNRHLEKNPNAQHIIMNHVQRNSHRIGRTT